NPLARVDAPWVTGSGLTQLGLSAREHNAIDAGVSLDLGRALTLDSQALAVTAQPGQGVARLSAPWLSWSNSQAALLVDQLQRAPLAA
ncbi:hypothetical protein, partial [Klebsiella pneumoniae]|uniref:hypothetical protein n=1 Tax=Klebsiella pneumoniae TaxID=573 RepID=UPI0027315101